MPPETFEDLDAAVMWVSRKSVTPLAIEDLPDALRGSGVERRVMERLIPLYGL